MWIPSAPTCVSGAGRYRSATRRPRRRSSIRGPLSRWNRERITSAGGGTGLACIAASQVCRTRLTPPRTGAVQVRTGVRPTELHRTRPANRGNGRYPSGRRRLRRRSSLLRTLAVCHHQPRGPECRPLLRSRCPRSQSRPCPLPRPSRSAVGEQPGTPVPQGPLGAHRGRTTGRRGLRDRAGHRRADPLAQPDPADRLLLRDRPRRDHRLPPALHPPELRGPPAR